MNTVNIQDVAKAAAPLVDSLDEFQTLSKKVFEATLDDNNDSNCYLTNCLRREDGDVQLLKEQLEYFVRQDQENAKNFKLMPSRVNAVLRREAIPKELGRIFNSDEHHAEELIVAIKECKNDDILTDADAKSFLKLIQDIEIQTKAFEKPIKILVAEVSARQDETPKAIHKPSEEEMTDPDYERDDTCCQDLVDAISRLQGSVGSSGGITTDTGGGAFAAFDRALGQRIGMTLGVPDLNGENARAMGADDLLEKLENGLMRSVIEEEEAGETRFRFNPLKARSSLDLSAETALGGQAIVRQTIHSMRAPFMTALNSIVSESVTGVQDEADDLREAAEIGFDTLALEAGSATGTFKPRVEALVRQIVVDVLQLAALGDVIDEINIYAANNYTEIELNDSDFDEEIDSYYKDYRSFEDWFANGLVKAGEFRAVKSLKPSATARSAVRNRDISFLTPEANEAALVAALGYVRSAYQLLLGDAGLGAMLGRVRALNDAILSSIAAVRPALSHAGVSANDLAVTYADGETNDTIELSRLLSWIENSSIADRTTYTRIDLNLSDLMRIRRIRKAQNEALIALRDAEFPTVTESDYSLGRRELNELARRVDDIAIALQDLMQAARRGHSEPVAATN